jgi:hypothetical protein
MTGGHTDANAAAAKHQAEAEAVRIRLQTLLAETKAAIAAAVA